MLSRQFKEARFAHLMNFQKMKILGLQQYDKLLWVNSDIRFRVNLDYLFRDYDVTDATYFMKDDESCMDVSQDKAWIESTGVPKLHQMMNGGYGTGLMLFKPDNRLLEHVMKQQSKKNLCFSDDVTLNK